MADWYGSSTSDTRRFSARRASAIYQSALDASWRFAICIPTSIKSRPDHQIQPDPAHEWRAFCPTQFITTASWDRIILACRTEHVDFYQYAFCGAIRTWYWVIDGNADERPWHEWEPDAGFQTVE